MPLRKSQSVQQKMTTIIFMVSHARVDTGEEIELH
jgi:hypothetical protein